MRKLLFFSLLLVAMTFGACGNQTQPTALPSDSIVMVDSASTDTVADTISVTADTVSVD